VIDAFARRKVPLTMDVELPSIEAIKKFVAGGNGVALLPMMAVEAEIARAELVHVPVPELRFERQLRIIFGRNAALSHAARAFLKTAEGFADHQGGRFLYRPER
jgi:DNA-binding transcriptional LysR family regulator